MVNAESSGHNGVLRSRAVAILSSAFTFLLEPFFFPFPSNLPFLKPKVLSFYDFYFLLRDLIF